MKREISPIIFFLMIFAAVMVPAQTSSGNSELKPGDGVRVTFYNISEKISGDYFVQQDGNLQLPFLGIIEAEGKYFSDIRKSIIEKYTGIYKDPELTVQPLYKVNILGEVQKPGLYYVTGVEKLSGLIALAGGETSDADIDNIKIIRDEQEIEVDAEEILAQGNTVDDIGLKSGDRIYVPREWWVGARNTAFIISGVAVLITLVSLFIK